MALAYHFQRKFMLISYVFNIMPLNSLLELPIYNSLHVLCLPLFAGTFPTWGKIQIGVLFSIYQHMIILALGLYSYAGFPQYKEEKTFLPF